MGRSWAIEAALTKPPATNPAPKSDKLLWIGLCAAALFGLVAALADGGTILGLVLLGGFFILLKRNKDRKKAATAVPSEAERQDQINAAERLLRLIQSDSMPPPVPSSNPRKWIANMQTEAASYTKTLKAAALVTDEEIRLLQSFRERLRREVLTPADALLAKHNFRPTERQREQAAKGIAVVDSFVFPEHLTPQAINRQSAQIGGSLGRGVSGHLHRHMGNADLLTVGVAVAVTVARGAHQHVKLKKEAEKMNGEVTLYRAETIATVDTLAAVRRQLLKFREQVSVCAEHLRGNMAKVEAGGEPQDREEGLIWLSMYAEQLRHSLDMKVV